MINTFLFHDVKKCYYLILLNEIYTGHLKLLITADKFIL